MKLQLLLEEYLLQSGSLPLAGIGLLSIEEKAAVMNPTEAVIEPPQTEIVFSTAKPSGEDLQALTEFVGQRLSVSNQQASQLLSSDNSATSLLNDTGSFELPSFGWLQNENGVIHFKKAENFLLYLPAIPLPKKPQQPEIEPVDNRILQPEELEGNIISAEPIEDTVALDTARKDNWWVWAIVIFVVSVLLILFRYL